MDHYFRKIWPGEIARRAVRLKLFAERILQLSTANSGSVLGAVDVILGSIEPAVEQWRGVGVNGERL
jgi:hypothetical protein